MFAEAASCPLQINYFLCGKDIFTWFASERSVFSSSSLFNAIMSGSDETAGGAGFSLQRPFQSSFVDVASTGRTFNFPEATLSNFLHHLFPLWNINICASCVRGSFLNEPGSVVWTVCRVEPPVKTEWGRGRSVSVWVVERVYVWVCVFSPCEWEKCRTAELMTHYIQYTHTLRSFY